MKRFGFKRGKDIIRGVESIPFDKYLDSVEFDDDNDIMDRLEWFGSV